jgi:hypothetical protein
MVTRTDMVDWVVQALKSNKGSGTILYVAKHIWDSHRKELESSGDFFFTWQYDMRWAATTLRRRGKMVAADDDRRGVWTLK